MTINELIEQLQEIEDKSKSVFVWLEGEIAPFELDELSDRLDFNVDAYRLYPTADEIISRGEQHGL
jgi:hypothetical protein